MGAELALGQADGIDEGFHSVELQRSEVEVGRDVLPMAYHDDIGTLYLRMLEDERYGAVENSMSLTILLPADIYSSVVVFYVL